MRLKCALLILDQFSGQQEFCWPKLPTLASAMCCSDRTAQRAIAGLKELDLLSYDDKNLGKASRRYQIEYLNLIPYQPAHPRGVILSPITDKQNYQGTISEHNGTAAAVKSSCLSDQEKTLKIRIQLATTPRAIELLEANGVWGKELTGLIRIAGATRKDGNPMPRLNQVIEMAKRKGDGIGNRGAWIKRCIEKGWQPNAP